MGTLGHPILPSGLMGIEKGTRRVDVGELVALAIALGGVTPNRLLLTESADRAGSVQLADGVSTSAEMAWRWAAGDLPLDTQPWESHRGTNSRIKEFRERNRPHDPDDGMVSADDFVRYEPVLRPLLEAARQAAGEVGISIDQVIKILELMTVIGPVEDD
jgi:hypothetical protein